MPHPIGLFFLPLAQCSQKQGAAALCVKCEAKAQIIRLPRTRDLCLPHLPSSVWI